MAKGKIPRQRRFQSLFNMPLRDVCFSGNIKPKKMRHLNCTFHGSSTIWFRLQPSQFIGHCPGVDSSVEYFLWLVACSRRLDERRMARIESTEKITRRVEREIIESLAR